LAKLLLSQGGIVFYHQLRGMLLTGHVVMLKVALARPGFQILVTHPPILTNSLRWVLLEMIGNRQVLGVLGLKVEHRT
jgi:hypothetical protein